VFVLASKKRRADLEPIAAARSAQILDLPNRCCGALLPPPPPLLAPSHDAGTGR
jgi:hypothetical protein